MLRDPCERAAYLAALFFWALLVAFVGWGGSPADAFLDAPIRALGFCIIGPVAEELVFRGAIQGWLAEKLSHHDLVAGVSIANLLTSLLFCLSHGLFRGAVQAAWVFPPSLWLGCIRERTGSVERCASVHVFWNLGVFVLWPEVL